MFSQFLCQCFVVTRGAAKQKTALGFGQKTFMAASFALPSASARLLCTTAYIWIPCEKSHTPGQHCPPAFKTPRSLSAMLVHRHGDVQAKRQGAASCLGLPMLRPYSYLCGSCHWERLLPCFVTPSGAGRVGVPFFPCYFPVVCYRRGAGPACATFTMWLQASGAPERLSGHALSQDFETAQCDLCCSIVFCEEGPGEARRIMFEVSWVSDEEKKTVWMPHSHATSGEKQS